MRVFYKQASQLYSYVHTFMLVYKRRASDTPILDLGLHKAQFL